jgi:thiosulfate reductase cytochrome b subunit
VPSWWFSDRNNAWVIFVAAPLIAATGLAMSPAVTAAVPFLLRLFGGYQSARTIISSRS